MARYQVGDEQVNRKHAWLPCVINDSLEGKSDEEVAAALRATWWSDLITNSEWPALLGHEGASKSARSKLKRKAIGWLMALGRIAYLDPVFFNTILEEARKLYLEQIGEPHPALDPPRQVADTRQPEEDEEA
jgi:hypothetical protein